MRQDEKFGLASFNPVRKFGVCFYKKFCIFVTVGAQNTDKIKVV